MYIRTQRVLAVGVSVEYKMTTEIMEGILWLNDWYEGQQYVDFIAFTEINGGDWK